MSNPIHIEHYGKFALVHLASPSVWWIAGANWLVIDTEDDNEIMGAFPKKHIAVRFASLLADEE